jgi:hypothetical protein
MPVQDLAHSSLSYILHWAGQKDGLRSAEPNGPHWPGRKGSGSAVPAPNRFRRNGAASGLITSFIIRCGEEAEEKRRVFFGELEPCGMMHPVYGRTQKRVQERNYIGGAII